MTDSYKEGCSWMKWGAWAPVVFCAAYLLLYPINSALYLTLIQEDHFIEWLTVVLSLFAAGIAVVSILHIRSESKVRLHIFLLALYTLACIFFAGEEITWGQRIFGFKTEDVSPLISRVNKANELTLHNIEAFDRLRNVSDLFCLVWGIVIPLVYRKRTFPIEPLRLYLSPTPLIPAYLGYFILTWPQKALQWYYPHEKWVNDLRIGELKEFLFAAILVLFICAVYQRIRHRNHPASAV